MTTKRRRQFSAEQKIAILGRRVLEYVPESDLCAGFVNEYNTVRLHSGIGYITPQDRLAGREQAIRDDRQRKLAEARHSRRLAHRDAVSAELAAQSEPAGVGAMTTASVAALCQ